MAEIDYSKGKIPGAESGIEIRHSVCDICTPGMHCGLDVYVKDGKVIKVEGTPDHPQNKGKLCTKGLGNRQYLYREDRILTPLRRVGERGEGKFEPISWEEAIDTIAEKLRTAACTRSSRICAIIPVYSFASPHRGRRKPLPWKTATSPPYFFHSRSRRQLLSARPT